MYESGMITGKSSKRPLPARVSCRVAMSSAYSIRRFAVVLLVWVAALAPLQAETTVDATNRWAWGAQIGWLDFRGDGTNGVVLGEYSCSGYAYAAHVGWISLGHGPTNGYQYSNASSNDWGVNHDGLGNLSGFAWGAQIGWISFETNYGKPRLDLQTGLLDGHVYSAAAGWISLSNAYTLVQTETLAPGPDNDGDGIPDAWEIAQTGGTNTLSGSGQDSDNDGLSDAEEYVADTSPTNPASALLLSSLSITGNTVALSWDSRPTRFYAVEQATTLDPVADWEDSGLGVQPPDAGSTTSREYPEASFTNRFLRVRAIRPLAP